MSTIAAVANLNLKEQPNKLAVTGSIITYNDKDTVKLELAIPQGIIGSTLLLNVVVTEVEGPKKGTPKPFYYEQSENASTYNKVQLAHKEGDTTIDVSILG